MKRLSRRAALEILTAGPVAAAMAWTPAEAEHAQTHAERARAQSAGVPGAKPFKPKFFTPHEYATVATLVNLIIPTDAGVPEFMDFMMVDQPRRQIAMRGGLALIDRLSDARFGKRFIAATDAQRRQLLDEIAYTSNVDPGLSHAVAFFSSFRDLTAGGFWSSRMGVADLQYQGNVFVSDWNGCPDEALKKLGLLPP